MSKQKISGRVTFVRPEDADPNHPLAHLTPEERVQHFEKALGELILAVAEEDLKNNRDLTTRLLDEERLILLSAKTEAAISAVKAKAAKKENVDTKLVEEWKKQSDGTYDILGQRMTMQEITDSFGVSEKAFRGRIEEGGLPPVDAALITQVAYRGLTLEESMFKGWCYWCEKEGLPLVDDLKWPLIEGKEYHGAWKLTGRTAQVGNGEINRMAGRCRLAEWLFEYRDNPVAIMRAWVQATLMEARVKVIPRWLDDHCEWFRTVSPVNYHHAVTTPLPDLFVEGPAYETLNRLCEIVFWERWDRQPAPRVHNMFDLLGLSAYTRKIVTEANMLVATTWFEEYTITPQTEPMLSPLAQKLMEKYKEKGEFMTPGDAEDAAKNLVGFFDTLLQWDEEKGRKNAETMELPDSSRKPG